MSVLWNAVKKAIFDKTIEIYKHKADENAIRKTIEDTFDQFNKSNNIHLDYALLEDYLVKSVDDMFMVYQNPNSDYITSEKKYRKTIIKKFTKLTKSEKEFVDSVCVRTLSCAKELIYNRLPDSDKVLINRQNAMHKTPSSNSTFSSLVKKMINQNYSDNPLNYDKNDIFVGRESVTDDLIDFLTSNDSILFCVLCGPGGSGKNKTVYNLFKNTTEGKQWTHRFVDSDSISCLYDINEWICDDNICLTYDDVDINSQPIKDFIWKVIANSRHKGKKLRLILLARGKKGDDDPLHYADWFKVIMDTKYSVGRYWFKNKFIYLDPMDQYDCSDLVNRYLRFRGKVIPSDDLSRFTKSLTTKGLDQPLYILVAIESYLLRPNIWFEKFDTTNIYQFIYERDCRSWSGRIAVSEVYVAIKKMYAYATILGEWDRNEDTPCFLSSNVKTLSNYASVRSDDAYAKWFSILSRTSNDGWVLYKHTPDLIGEYFVLKVFADLSFDELKEWMKFILMNEPAKEYIERIINDYGDNDSLSKIVERILIACIEAMDGKQENKTAALIVNKYLKDYPLDVTKRVRKKLCDNYDKIRGELCWKEVYIDNVLAVHNIQTISFIQWCYPQLMDFCKKCKLLDSDLLSSRTITALGELIRYSIAEYSSASSERNKRTLLEYVKEYLSIKKKVNANSDSVRESIISAESRMIEAIISMSEKSKVKEIKDFEKTLTDSFKDQKDLLKKDNANASLSVCLSLIDGIERLERSNQRSGKQSATYWLKEYIDFFEKAKNKNVYRLCAIGLVDMITLICIESKSDMSQYVDKSFSSLKNVIDELNHEQIDPTIDSYSLLSYMERVQDKFFNHELIDEKYKSVAIHALGI